MPETLKNNAGSDNVFVEKYVADDIKLGSQLIVNQSQEAIFVKGGVALDLFGPGTHTLTTGNMSMLSGLMNRVFGSSPFSSEIWYINKTIKRNIPWGTSARIPIMDPRFNFLINLGAHGQWGVRIKDSRSFVSQLVGSQLGANAERVESYFIGEILEKFSVIITSFVIENSISLVEINSKLTELSKKIIEYTFEEFDRYGIEIVNFNITNISIPSDELKQLQSVMAKRMEMEMLGNVKVGQGYVTAKSFEVMQTAANNQGNAGGAMASMVGMGLGLGTMMNAGDKVASAMKTPKSNDYIGMLKQLKELFEAELITETEYQAKKKEIIDNNF